jgi:hypothetical protein
MQKRKMKRKVGSPLKLWALAINERKNKKSWYVNYDNYSFSLQLLKDVCELFHDVFAPLKWIPKDANFKIWIVLKAGRSDATRILHGFLLQSSNNFDGIISSEYRISFSFNLCGLLHGICFWDRSIRYSEKLG